MRNNRVSYYDYARYGGRSVYVAESVIFEDLTKVDDVIKKLLKSINENGYATLAEYYELVGACVLESDSSIGWTDLLGIQINCCRCGYELVMTQPKDLRVNPIKDAYDILQGADEDSYGPSIEDAIYYLKQVL